MKKLSIIVPVYNVESYLAKCLDSLLQQDISYEDYEIIVVNDGSTDNSLETAERYQRQYENIHLISQENRGLGAARNVGIKEAKGKCLFFVDSDDYIQPNCLKTLLACFEQNDLEILHFNYETVDEKNQIIHKSKYAANGVSFKEEIVDGEMFFLDYMGWACYVWVYFFDTEFIRKNNFLFNENIYFEDVEWLLRVLLGAKRIKSKDIYVYNYLQRKNSITKSVDIERKNKILDDKLFVVDFLVELSHQNYKDSTIKKIRALISLTIRNVLGYVQNELPDRKKDLINYIRTEHLLPFRNYRLTTKQVRDLFLINLSPELYCWLKSKKPKKYH